jgi:hypothetical protein
MLTLLFLLAACPTEVPDAGNTTTGAPPPTGEAGAAPAPGEAGPPAPGGGQPTQISVDPGTGVMVKGTASYGGTAEGKVRLDVLKKGTAMPELAYSTTLDAIGPFEVELPKNFGSVQVTVFVDTTGDGPTVGEPMAASAWFDVGETPPEPLTLVLTKLNEGGSGGPPPMPGPEGAPAGPPPGGGDPAAAGAAPGAAPADPAAAGAAPAGAPPAAAPTAPK